MHMKPKVFDEIIPTGTRETIKDVVDQELLIHLVVGFGKFVDQSLDLTNILFHQLPFFHPCIV